MRAVAAAGISCTCLREGYDVFGVDPIRRPLKPSGALRLTSGGKLSRANCRSELVPDAFADVVICNTVLHFARDDDHFRAMLLGAWRSLKPGGLSFSALRPPSAANGC
jgi:2-polyprenyl-3-methyl-5-hydroxy-6-metoxy-1,4-benzoquinol methylase